MLLGTFPTLLTACICGENQYRRKIVNGSFYKECTKCGLVRSGVVLFGENYRKKASEYDLIYTHTLGQDQQVARARLEQWGLKKGDKVFDVGAGLGCFVEACRAEGIQAEGVDARAPMVASEFIYSDVFEDLHYPASSVNVVTMFDVLEHMGEPIQVLLEVRRILQFGGRLLIEVPDFGVNRHWKPKEHFWCFEPKHIIWAAKEAGLEYVEGSLRSPVPGKWALEFSKPLGKRVRVVVPPGIGDAYWSLVKLPSLMKEWGVTEEPEVHVMLESKKPYERGLEFLRKIPFVVPGEYVYFDGSDPVWKEGYFENGRVVFENWHGYDYVVMYNGRLRKGFGLADSYPQGISDWRIPLFRTMEQRKNEKRYSSLCPCILVFLFDISVHKRFWNAEFPLERFKKPLVELRNKYKANILAIGGPRENSDSIKPAGFGSESNFIDLIQKTDQDELFALLNLCHGVIGHPCGPNLLAACQGKPSVLVWNSYFDKRMWEESVAPSVRGTTYYAVNTKSTNAKELVDRYTEAATAFNRRIRRKAR